MTDQLNQILQELQAHAAPANRAGMVRYGIAAEQAYGVKVPVLREIAKAYRGEHELALALWETGIHEARLLAPLIADSKQ